MTNNKINLSSVPEKSRVKVVGLEAGANFGRKLQALGIHVGDTVVVMRNHGGTIIVGRQIMRIAIGRGMGSKIYVEPVAAAE